MPDLIETILPPARIHLIGGNSNVGKTRYLLPMILEWQAGEKVLGFRSNPVPWAYVSGDRLLIEAQDTISGMGLDPQRIPIIPAFGPDNKDWRQVMRAAAAAKLGFLVWEGFADFCYGERKKEVREFLSHVSAACHSSEYHNGCLTILGVMESPKLKAHERYNDPRQRISGIASWGYHTSSVFLIEADNPKNLSCAQRTLHVSIKNGVSFQAKGEFDASGRLRFLPPDNFDL